MDPSYVSFRNGNDVDDSASYFYFFPIYRKLSRYGILNSSDQFEAVIPPIHKHLYLYHPPNLLIKYFIQNSRVASQYFCTKDDCNFAW